LSRRYPLAPLYETRSGGTDCRLSSRLPRNNRGKARIATLDSSQARLGRALLAFGTQKMEGGWSPRSAF
jgi:hypothetical protein